MMKPVERIIRLAKRWWWLFLVGALVPALIAYLLLARRPDAYQAKATLVIGTSLENPDPDQWQLNVANTLANAYARLAKEGPVMQDVIERLGLNRRPDQLAEQVSTSVYPEAQLLEISIVDTDSRSAALIANALADELVRRSPVSQEDITKRQTFIRGQLDDLELQIEQLDSEIAELRSSLIELTSATELNEAQNRLDQLETAKTNLQSTYATLLDSYQTESPNIVSVFDPAVEPTSPLPRRDALVAGVGGFAGLMLAIGGVTLIETLDTTVKWEGASKGRLLGMPVLGAVANLPLRSGSAVKAVDPLSPTAEMVRGLRTNIFLAAGDRSLETLLLTSPQLNDGKTFLIAQLGIAIAAAGRRVLMMDADLRKPSLHECFDLPNVQGLSDLLAGKVELDPTPGDDGDWPPGTRETGFDNLHLLVAGKPPLDPSLLLTSSRLNRLFEMLKERVDVILVDSPPYLAAPDAGVLASVVDGTVLVARAGATDANKLERAQKELEEREGVHLLGLAFNGVKRDGDAYYYAPEQEPDQGRVHQLARGLARRVPFIDQWMEQAIDGDATVGVPTVAETLGVTRRVARRWCKEGRVPASRQWLRWRVKEEDLESVLAEFQQLER